MSSQSISFRPTTIIKRLPWSFDKKAALGFLLILVTLSLVGWLYLGQASIITSSTLEMDQLRHQIQILTQKNSELAFEIAQLESITRVEQRARDMGFAPTSPQNIRYLVTPNYPVVDTPAPEVLVTHTAPPKDPLWQVWLDNVMAWVEGQSE